MSRPEPGDVLDGKYRVERVLGEGGMGFVLQATHTLREAPVALKFLLPEVAAVPEVVERFVNEAVAASKLECEHVIRVHDVGEREGLPYLVMEYLEGEDLDAAADAGPFGVARAVHVLLQVLRALSAAHEKGIVHRDLKPANVFLTRREGEADYVKLLDFGVSKLERPDQKRLTATASGLGTPLYMSPEQARSAKDVDQRTDIYAAGVILYQVLAGRPPFDGETITELLSKILLDEEERIDTIREDLPSGLADVVHRALSKNPDERFPNADAFARALVPFADDRSAVLVARLRARDARAMRDTAPSQVAEVPDAGREAPTSRAVVASTAPAAQTAATFAKDQVPSQAGPGTGKRSIGTVVGVVAAGVLVIAGVVFYLSRAPGAAAPVADATSAVPAESAPVPVDSAPEPVPAVSAPPEVAASSSAAPVPSPSATEVASAAPPAVAQPKTAPTRTSKPTPANTGTSKPRPESTPSTPSNPLDIELK